MHLLFLFLLLAVVLLLGGLSLLSPDTAGTPATKRRGQREVDVLLGVETDDERGNVDDLLSDSDVTLADQNTGVVDRLGKTELPDTGLETALKEILDLKSQDVIELHAGLVKDTDTDKTSNEGIAFEETLGVLLVEGKKLTVQLVRKLFLISAHTKCQGSHTGQHDGSWTESDRLARPHACCAGHIRQRASARSHCCRIVSFGSQTT